MILKKIPKRTLPFRFREIKDVWGLLCSGSIEEGNFIKGFEEKFKDFVGAQETIALSSGRFGLYLILKNLGLKQGDGVLLSAYNFRGVPKALLQDGFIPVFVDADKKTYQISPEDIEKRISPNVKAIILTHLFGQPAEIDKIKDIAKRHNLFLIEDAAHSLGSYYQGGHTGTFAHAGFFSFAGSKTLNTSFGGMVVTGDKELACKIREDLNGYDFPTRSRLLKQRITTCIHALLTNRIFYSLTGYPITLLLHAFNKDPLEIYKSLKKKEVSEYKMKFTNLQGLLGLRQMEKLGSLVSQRQRNAQGMFQKLDSAITLQAVPPKCSPNYFMVALKTRNKKEASKKLLRRGIDSNLNYANDCAALYGEEGFPGARFLSDSILTIQLPFHLTEREIEYLACSINEIKEIFV